MYNEDGTEFKVAPKITTTPKVQPKKEKQKEEQSKSEKLQTTLFDFLDTNIDDEHEEDVEEETQEEIVDLPPQEEQQEIQKENLIIDKETGEVLTQSEQINPFDDEVTTSLFSIFQNILEVK